MKFSWHLPLVRKISRSCVMFCATAKKAGCFLQRLLAGVGIATGHRPRLVTEPCLDDALRHAPIDRPACEGVAEIVEVDLAALREAVLSDHLVLCRRETCADAHAIPESLDLLLRLAGLRVRQHPGRRLRSLCQLCATECAKRLWRQRNYPSLGCLGPVLVEVAEYDPLPLEVHLVPTQVQQPRRRQRPPDRQSGFQ